jgi:hypothetical protein
LFPRNLRILLLVVAVLLFVFAFFGPEDGETANLAPSRTSEAVPFRFYPIAEAIEPNKNPSVWLTLRLESPTGANAGDIGVTIFPCGGMGTLQLAQRPRHLASGQESLRAAPGGHSLIWNTKLDRRVRELRLRFQIPDLIWRGPMFYCLTVMAYRADDQAPPPHYTMWWYGGK